MDLDMQESLEDKYRRPLHELDQNISNREGDGPDSSNGTRDRWRRKERAMVQKMSSNPKTSRTLGRRWSKTSLVGKRMIGYVAG